jgi:hypothetical protein
MTSHALRIVVPCLVALLGALPAVSSAQSLGDVAKASAASRKEQPKPGKVYTNGDLRTDITPSSPTPTPGTTPAVSDAGSGSATATPADAAAANATGDAGAKDQAYWKGRMTSAREALERSTSFASALQSQINGLTVDFVNRDDPAQRAGIEQRRTKAVAELERVQREIDTHKKAITAVEDEARKAGVPAGWLR